MVCITLEGLRMVSDRLADFQFFVKFHRFRPAIISVFELSQSMLVMHQKNPNEAKDHINIVSVTLEVLRMISDRIVDFPFFVKFHKSRSSIIFSF